MSYGKNGMGEGRGKGHAIKATITQDSGGQHLPLARCEEGALPTTTPWWQRQEDCLDQSTHRAQLGLVTQTLQSHMLGWERIAGK